MGRVCGHPADGTRAAQACPGSPGRPVGRASAHARTPHRAVRMPMDSANWAAAPGVVPTETGGAMAAHGCCALEVQLRLTLQCSALRLDYVRSTVRATVTPL